MAYAASGLKLLVAGMGGGPAIWFYSTTDAHTSVDADDYFTDGDDYGMKQNDIVFVVDTDTVTTTIHHVRAPVTAGTASVSIATLS